MEMISTSGRERKRSLLEAGQLRLQAAGRVAGGLASVR